MWEDYEVYGSEDVQVLNRRIFQLEDYCSFLEEKLDKIEELTNDDKIKDIINKRQ